ncbi:MAG: FHA domain-containing protein [Chitinispirillaceae bacterium]|nr:FHA domain-containing protein [Chitinispirillaceae bacterium]
MVKFMVFYEGKPLNTYVLDEPVITVGRLPENTISIANMGVSRRHIRIEEDFDRKYILTDLNSLNGSMVNGKRVKKVPLHSGDKITIGKFTIIYEEIASVAGAAVPEKSDAGPVVAPSETPIEEADDKRSGTRTARKVAEEPPPREEEEVPRGHTQRVQTAASEEAEEEKTPMLIDTAKHLTYILDKPYMTLGNGDSDDIPVSGFMVSERQAFIEETAEGWRISTSKMIGKLKINGRQVKSHVLQHKDRVDLGSTSFRYMENG